MSSLDGLTAGVNVILTFTDLNGNILVQDLQKFDWKYDTNIPKKVLMNGTVKHPKFFQGVSGSFVVFRGSASLETYFSNSEGAYLLGGDQIPVVITETITNVDGTTNQWQFLNCVLDMTDGGSSSGDDVITQTVAFMGSQRIKVY